MDYQWFTGQNEEAQNEMEERRSQCEWNKINEVAGLSILVNNFMHTTVWSCKIICINFEKLFERILEKG